ncbi:MAG: tetratricopeptide repeat protein, partial [Beijerinckiaceae bacterium]
MLISDIIRAVALGCAVGFAPFAAVAFEVKDATPDMTPSRALPALPGIAVPSVPDFGVEKSMKDAWRNFLHSYRSGDKKAALKQLQAASDQGDILAQWKLGRMHAEGDGMPQDHYKAFQLYSKIADMRPDESRDSPHAGVVANAFVALGHYWLDGIPQSPVKPHAGHAAKAFNYAAVYFGHPEAQYQLARMLLDGQIGKSDPR